MSSTSTNTTSSQQDPNIQTQQQQQQLQSLNEFIVMIQDKQVEHALKLSKQESVTVNGTEYKRKSLSAKQWREIAKLNNQMTKLEQGSDAQLDKLIELRTKGAEYYFGIPANIFDENYEKLNTLIEGCILRSNTGLSPDIDLNEILKEYQDKQRLK